MARGPAGPAMRLALLVLAAASLAMAAPAAADVTVDGLPVYACLNGVCTPCPDPVTVPAPVLDFTFNGADC